MSENTAAPVPLHIPAILQNPQNRAARQVEAYKAQQREKAAARKTREVKTEWNPDHNGKGKRVIRRLDNAAFASNPHIVRPSKSDYTPPVPLQSRPPRHSFPADTIPRSAPMAPVAKPDRDPFSADSLSGGFSTSLKGTRAMLRKRGKRAEGLVTNAESHIRAWLAGDFSLDAGTGSVETNWRAIDDRRVDYVTESGSTSSDSKRRKLPAQHQIIGPVPALPFDSNGQLPVILELSRSPAHLSWFLADSFDRLVIHLVCRYYELVSWSEEHKTVAGDSIRLTHIILPNIAKPKPLSAGYPLQTPETSELSGQSSSEASHLSAPSASESESDRGTVDDSDSDAGTERGVGSDGDTDDLVEGYTLVEASPGPDATLTSTPLPELSDLALSDTSLSDTPLHRTHSATSSQYASSEGGVAGSDFGGLGDSGVLPPLRWTGAPAAGNGGGTTGGWIDFSDGSEFGDTSSVASGLAGGSGVRPMLARFTARGWEEKPTFFDYLYGA
ncbi:hypothetical protein IAT38_006700 [Cryptococcus sp. DSM 104549]